jgi:hypothetical protein
VGSLDGSILLLSILINNTSHIYRDTSLIYSMTLKVVTETSRRTTASTMQRSHYAIIHTASAHKKHGPPSSPSPPSPSSMGVTMGKAQLSSICETIIRHARFSLQYVIV